MDSRNLKCLENTFGVIPSSVFENIKYFTYDDGKKIFTCNPCERDIHKSAPKTLKSHLNSNYHQKNFCSTNKVKQALTKSYQGKIPQIVLNNIYVLDVNGNNYECVICEKMLNINNFSYHLSSSDHEKQLEDYYTTIEELKDVFGGIPEIVKNNKEFLKPDNSGKNYVCTVCNVSLIVYKNDIERTEDEFEDHLYSSQHRSSVITFKIKLLITELQQSNVIVPSFLMRNIDYLSLNGSYLFCSACNENIRYNHNDISETMQSLKIHMLSENHEDNVLGRRDCNSEVFENLYKVFDDFTGEILKGLKYLELRDNSFTCNICNEKICKKTCCDEVKDYITCHFGSISHKNNISEEIQRQSSLIENFGGIFGCLPTLIQDNIGHIQFKGINDFQCTLCGATMQSKKKCDDLEYIKMITEENFEKHLDSNNHSEALDVEDDKSKLLQEKLEDLFDPIPECIEINWSHLKFENRSGNFCCVLCKKTIIVDGGNKKEEVTLQNFTSHLFSVGHKAKIKSVADREIEAERKLQSIFGTVPGYILSNVEYIHHNANEDSYFCDLCDFDIPTESYPEKTKKNFYQHLTGRDHKSNIKDIESSISNAFRYLDHHFCVPEFLLRDIDFWDNFNDDDLYCRLCQEVLAVDLQDLRQTRLSLLCHMEGERHKSHLEHF